MHLLSCHPQEVCLAAGKVRERREKIKAKLKNKTLFTKIKKLTKLFSQRLMLENVTSVTKQEGLI